MRSCRAVLLLLVLLSARPVAAGEASTLEVRLHVGPQGVLQVEEAWRFAAPPERFTRTVHLEAWAGGSFPLRQRVTGVAVTDGEGRPLSFRRLDYGLDRVVLQPSPARTLRLSYNLHGAASTVPEGLLVKRDFRFYDRDDPLAQMRWELDPAGWRTARLEVFTWDADYAENLFGEAGAGARLEQVARNVPPRPRVEVTCLVVPAPTEGLPVASEYAHQLFVPLVLLGIGVLAGLVLRLCPAPLAVAWVRLANPALVGAVAWLLVPLFWFDVLSP